MPIEFLCPNGHRIRCPADRAGQRAKCPKCGIKFIVPDASEDESADATGGDSAVTQTAPGGPGSSAVKSGPGSGVNKGTDQIEFLCPNGHLLHGSRQLQGHPGQCPECGSKFRIPTYEDADDEGGIGTNEGITEEKAKPSEPQVGLEPLESHEDSAVTLPEMTAEEKDVKLGPPPLHETFPVALQGDGSGRWAQARGTHPLSELFCRLWAKKSKGAVIELHFGDGETLIPDRFARPLSQGSHGLFAVKEPDGTYTLTAIAWESISRVLVKHVHELPEEMRE